MRHAIRAIPGMVILDFFILIIKKIMSLIVDKKGRALPTISLRLTPKRWIYGKTHPFRKIQKVLAKDMGF
jgi:hypothetical protein